MTSGPGAGGGGGGGAGGDRWTMHLLDHLPLVPVVVVVVDLKY